MGVLYSGTMKSELDIRVQQGEVLRAPGLYDHLEDLYVDGAIAFAREKNQNVALVIGGVSVMVAPGSNRDEVVTNWRQIWEAHKLDSQ